MIRSELSAQQLDPLGGVTAQGFAWIFTAAAIATAVGLTIVHRAEYRVPGLLVVAFMLLCLSCILVLLASAPRRAPFTWRSALALHVLCLAAVGFEAAAQWGGNLAVRSDWAPLALALLVMGTGWFRPAREILIMTGVSTAFVAFVTAVGAAASTWELPPVVYAGLTAGPLLAAGAGAAAFSSSLVRRLRRWRGETEGSRLAAAESLRELVRGQLHDERAALVEREVGPFLRELLAAGEVSEADAARARELGESLRRVLVAEADDVWLDDVVTELHDPEGWATRMSPTERAAIDATCAALADHHVVATLDRADDRVRVVLRWRRAGRGKLGPEHQAVLRSVFPGARVRPGLRLIVLEFDAD